MRHMRKGAGLIALLTILTAPEMFAGNADSKGPPSDRFGRVKRFVIVVFSRIGLPPGQP